MPTWGYFIVALVVIDLTVMIAWLIVKSVASSHSAEPHESSATDTDFEIRRLKSEGNATRAIRLLNERTGLPLRDAKATVDRL